MDRSSTKPIIIGAAVGALIGAGLALIIVLQHSKDSQRALNPRHTTSIAVTALSLAKQVIEALV